MMKSGSGVGNLAKMSQEQEALMSGPGTRALVIMRSCSTAESSLIVNGDRNSIFTKYFIRGHPVFLGFENPNLVQNHVFP